MRLVRYLSAIDSLVNMESRRMVFTFLQLWTFWSIHYRWTIWFSWKLQKETCKPRYLTVILDKVICAELQKLRYKITVYIIRWIYILCLQNLIFLRGSVYSNVSRTIPSRMFSTVSHILGLENLYKTRVFPLCGRITELVTGLGVEHGGDQTYCC